MSDYLSPQIFHIPPRRRFQPLPYRIRGLVAKQPFRLADISQGMPDVAGAEIAVDRVWHVEMRALGLHAVANKGEKLVQGGTLAKGHIVDLIDRFWILGGGGQEVGLDAVVNIAKVAGGFPVAVYLHWIVAQHGGVPFGNDRGVGPVRVLAAAVDIEIAQADARKAVGTGEDVGIEFVHVLGHGVGRQGGADGIFVLGQLRMIAIGRTGGGVDEPGHIRVPGRDQHVHKAVDIALVGPDGILNGARHRAQRGLVQDIVHALTGLAAGCQIPDIALEEGEIVPLGCGDAGMDVVQIVLVAGGKIVQADDPLVQLEQGFQEIGADEASYTGDEPGVFGIVEFVLHAAGGVFRHKGSLFAIKCSEEEFFLREGTLSAAKEDGSGFSRLVSSPDCPFSVMYFPLTMNPFPLCKTRCQSNCPHHI